MCDAEDLDLQTTAKLLEDGPQRIHIQLHETWTLLQLSASPLSYGRNVLKVPGPMPTEDVWTRPRAPRVPVSLWNGLSFNNNGAAV